MNLIIRSQDFYAEPSDETYDLYMQEIHLYVQLHLLSSELATKLKLQAQNYLNDLGST